MKTYLPCFFSKGANHKQQIANMVNINFGQLPMAYSGIPYQTKNLKEGFWMLNRQNKKKNSIIGIVKCLT